MKQVYFIFYCLLAFLGCVSDQQETSATFVSLPITEKQPPYVNESPRPERKLAFLFVKDASDSFPIQVSHEQLHDWMQHQVKKQPTLFGGLNILSQSSPQHGYMSREIRFPKLQPIEGNFIEAGRIKSQNESLLADYQVLFRQTVNDFHYKIFTPKGEQYSDINNALRLASTMASGQVKAGRTVYVIVLSDLIQDTRKYKVLRPVSFPPTVKILVMGRHFKVDLRSVFPDNDEIMEVAVFDELNHLDF